MEDKYFNTSAATRTIFKKKNNKYIFNKHTKRFSFTLLSSLCRSFQQEIRVCTCVNKYKQENFRIEIYHFDEYTHNIQYTLRLLRSQSETTIARSVECNMFVSFIYHPTETLQCNTKLSTFGRRTFKLTKLHSVQIEQFGEQSCQQICYFSEIKLQLKLSIILCNERIKFVIIVNNHSPSSRWIALKTLKIHEISVTHVQCTKRISMSAYNSFRTEVKAVGVWALRNANTLHIQRSSVSFRYILIDESYVRWTDEFFASAIRLYLTHTRTHRTNNTKCVCMFLVCSKLVNAQQCLRSTRCTYAYKIRARCTSFVFIASAVKIVEFLWAICITFIICFQQLTFIAAEYSENNAINEIEN